MRDVEKRPADVFATIIHESQNTGDEVDEEKGVIDGVCIFRSVDVNNLWDEHDRDEYWTGKADIFYNFIHTILSLVISNYHTNGETWDT